MEKNKKRNIRNIACLICAAVVVACGVLLIVPCGNVAAAIIAFAGAISVLASWRLSVANDKLQDAIDAQINYAETLRKNLDASVKREDQLLERNTVLEAHANELVAEITTLKTSQVIDKVLGTATPQEEPKAKRVVKRSGSKNKISEIKAAVKDISENIQK